MIARHLFTVVPMSVIVLCSGAAVAGNTSTDNVEMMDFVETTSTLLAYPRGRALGAFLHTDFTQHLPGAITHDTHGVPPDPCDGLTRAWNHPALQRSLQGRRVQLVILAVMARAQCNAVLVTDPTTDPPTIVSITPTRT